MLSLAQIRSLMFSDSQENIKDVSFLFPVLPYNSLKFKKRSGHKKKIIHSTIHRGFDTETNYKGDIIILRDDQGRVCEDVSLKGVLSYLSYKEYRNTINWFYNITFDVESILKMLPADELKEIMNDNKTEYRGFKLFYLPHKYLSITDQSKHKISFWDIAQFYHMSLDNASKKYLNDEKGVSDIKSLMERLGSEGVLEIVSEYCVHDCVLTRRLAEKMHKGVRDCGIPFSKPYSVASLSETAFLEKCDIPQYLEAPLGVNKYFYWSYYGGWFELMKRGFYNDKIYEYDINSAYPYAMLNLPDIRDLKWERVKSAHKDSVIGVYLIEFSPHRHNYISPLQIRTENVSVHPQAFATRYVTHLELDMLRDVGKVKIISAFEGYSDKIRYPFREYVQKLYRDKSKYKNKDEMMYEAVKKVLNGFYGKNIQRSGGKVGNCFNPIYAALITASCRNQIWNAVKDHQKEVIGIQTDSCMMISPIDLEVSDELGGWELKEYNEGIFLLSGIYEMSGEKKKTKIRGYDTKMELKDLLLKYPNSDRIEIGKEKPLHLSQAVGWKRYEASQTNMFIDDIKTISCNHDDKRVWTDECENWGEFCNEYFDSTPITKHYPTISESEYIQRKYQVMRERKDTLRDGESLTKIKMVV